MGIVYYFRYEVRLLVFKYCSFFLCCFRMRRTPNDNGRSYHAFISYSRDKFDFVDTNIYEPLKTAGYQVAVNYASLPLLLGTHLRGFAQVMEHSSTCIIVISQSYLDDRDTMYEFDEALACSLDDPDFTLILIATKAMRDLKNVPRWLRAYMRTHLFIDADDFELLAKLKRALPELNSGRVDEDVAVNVAIHTQPPEMGGRSNQLIGDSTMEIDAEHAAMEQALRAEREGQCQGQGATDTTLLLP